MRNSKFQIPNSKNNGSVLLLSLLVLSGVVVTGFTIGDFLLRDFASSRRTDEAITAFYAAESGLESGMYSVRKEDVTLASLAGEQILANNAKWLRATSDEIPSIITSLNKDDSLTVDLFNSEAADAGGLVDSLSLSWEDTCGGCSWIEVGYVEWTPALGINWTENFSNIRYPIAASPVTITNFDGTRAYRVRITSHYGDVRNLTISAYTGEPGVPTPIRYAIVTMTSRGEFGRTAQVLQATFARQAPLQKLFDFVAFTECPIIKGGAGICP